MYKLSFFARGPIYYYKNAHFGEYLNTKRLSNLKCRTMNKHV